MAAAVRDYLYIDDMVAACRLAMVGPSGTYNIGAGIGTSLNDLVEQVQQITGKTLLVKKQPARTSDVKCIVLESARARNILGWRPLVGLCEGLRLTWSGLQ